MKKNVHGQRWVHQLKQSKTSSNNDSLLYPTIILLDGFVIFLSENPTFYVVLKKKKRMKRNFKGSLIIDTLSFGQIFYNIFIFVL